MSGDVGAEACAAFEAWLDGEGVAAAARLAAATADPARLAELVAHARIARGLTALHGSSDPSAVADRVLALIARSTASHRLRTADAVARRLRRPPRASRGRGRAAFAAAAIVVLAAVAVVALHRSPRPPSLTVAVCAADARVAGAAARIGAGLHDGDDFAAGGGELVLALDDGTRIACAAGARGAAVTVARATTLRLDAGVLSAVVAKRPPDGPLRFTTAAAEAVVVGTRLRLAVDDDGTRLAVDEGRVRLRTVTAETLVDAGHAARARRDGAIADDATPSLTMPALTTPALATRAPTIEPGLAAWRPLRGAWRADRGVLIGQTDPDRHCRIATVDAYGDVAFACRIRGIGVPYAEFQVGDYARFAPLDLGDDSAWHELRVAVHGSALTATLDGRAVACEAPGGGGGDASAPLRGPIHLYASQGRGRVELADLRDVP